MPKAVQHKMMVEKARGSGRPGRAAHECLGGEFLPAAPLSDYQAFG